MSKLIQKFRPPKLSQWDLENGVRRIQEESFVDYLGQTLKAGDFVLYTTNDSIYEIGKVIGIYQTVDEKRSSIYLSVAFERKRYWVREDPPKVKRQSGILPERLVKISLDACGDKVSKNLETA